MRRLAGWIPLTLCLSCIGQAEERPAPMGFVIRSPNLDLSRITSQIHLRVFPKADLRCDTNTGQIQRAGARVVDAWGGGRVRPDIRCDATMWDRRMSEFDVPGHGAVAQPVDVCFAINETRQVSVPAGSYIVLVEGSGNFTGPGGSTMVGILGSGCAEVTVTAGQQQSLQITLQEQSGTAGVCHDRELGSDEDCDEGPGNSDACFECHFPERNASNATSGNRRRPSVAWAPGRRLVVGFDNSDDVFVHLFDETGAPITSPAALANDQSVDSTSRDQQGAIRLASTGSGWTAVWESNDRVGGTEFDINAVSLSNFDPLTAPPDVKVNVTSTAMGQSRRAPAVAISGSRIAWLFEERPSQTLRVASAPFGSPQMAPTMDVPLTTAMGASPATEARLAALANGFVAVWTAGAMGSRDVYAMRLDADGTPMGSPVMVNTQVGMDQDQPAIAANGNDVVIAWRDTAPAGSDLFGSTIRWRHFDAALVPDGGERIAPNTVNGNQQMPAVAIDPSGVVLIAWQHEEGGTVRGRLFNLAGQPQLNRFSGTEADFQINAPPGQPGAGMGPRVNLAAAFGGAGRFVVAWEDQNGDGAGHAQIHFRTLSSSR